MNKVNITYVFGSGRKEKIQKNNFKAKEFFYGYNHFLKTDHNLNIIEMEVEDPKVFGLKKILRLLDKIFRKFTNLPFFFTEILSFKNFITLLKTDKLIVTNDRLALSLLPFLLVVKVIKNIEIYVIIMGLFSKKGGKYITNKLQKFFIKLLLRISKKICFLGSGEATLANDQYSYFSNRFYLLPFSIDTEYWNVNENEYSQNKKILFIGNDGNRDYEMFLKIVKSLPDFSFTCITNNINKQDVPPNCELISGSWNDSLLSDDQIKDYYRNSKLVIVPLKETFQPSGQSVSLQAMSMGVPVIITKTKGFWDSDLFEHEKNIYFVLDHSIESWVKELKKIYDDDNLLEKISTEAKITVNSELNLDSFNYKIEKLLNI